MSTEMATDEVTDSIAHIEMQRQDAQREEGLAAACRDALRKLQELLAQERAAIQAHSPHLARSANIDAVTIEIDRIKRLAGGANSRPGARQAPAGRHLAAPANAPRNRARNKGRRSMLRSGGR
jgi:hypothetical protein